MTKSGREIMEIFEAFDLTGTAWSAAQLTGCDAKTVARYVAVRDAGGALDLQALPGRPGVVGGDEPESAQPPLGVEGPAHGPDPGGGGGCSLYWHGPGAAEWDGDVLTVYEDVDQRLEVCDAGRCLA